MKRVLGYLITILSIALSCQAQSNDVTPTTATPVSGSGHDYIHLMNETVNPVNGSVDIRIPVPLPAGRQLSIPFAITYNTDTAFFLTPISPTYSNPYGEMDWVSSKTFLASGGWTYTAPVLSTTIMKKHYADTDVPGAPIETCTYYDSMLFSSPDGRSTPLGTSFIIDNDYDCTHFAQVWEVNGFDKTDPYRVNMRKDGTHFKEVEIADAHGKVYHFPNSERHSDSWASSAGGNSTTWLKLADSIEDTNGNKINIVDNNNGAFVYTDTLNRSLLTSSGFGSGTTTLNVSGMAKPYTIEWESISFTDIFGGYTPLSPRTGYACGGTGGVMAPPINVIHRITLPNDGVYTFDYDPTYGLLSKITYPNGAYVSYTWGIQSDFDSSFYMALDFDTISNSIECADRYSRVVVKSRDVSFDGSTIALHQDYAYTTNWSAQYPVYWESKTTTVTSTDKITGSVSSTRYTYSPKKVIPNLRIPIWGNIRGHFMPVEGTVEYHGSSDETLLTVNKDWLNFTLLNSVEQVVPKGTSLKTVYSYGYGGQIVRLDEYVNGATSPTRTTATTYQSFAVTPIYSKDVSIFDRPLSVVVKDSQGTGVAETDYNYDEVDVSPTSSVLQHDEVAYGSSVKGPRGNATKITKKCLQSGCADLVTQYRYDETGQVVKSFDGKQNETGYAYDDSGSGKPSTGTTNAYVTKITYPKTGEISHEVKFSYDYTTGYLVEADDQNSQATNYTYADPLNRLTKVEGPVDPNNGNQRPTSTYSYNDSGSSPSITKTVAQSPNPSVTTVQIMDGIGHVVQSRTDSDLGGVDYVDVTYDGNGRVYKTSNPYRSQTESTYGLVTTLYDALGRMTSQSNADGKTSRTWKYSGNTVSFTDENGNKWDRTSDAFGKLVQVVEPGSLNTDYSYDLLNNLVGVKQSGNVQAGDVPRIRSFSYNSLSQLLCASNPENSSVSCPTTNVMTYVAGTMGYTYDLNGNLSAKKDARGITITYSYDELNRLLSKTYSDGSPYSCYQYDTSEVSGVGVNLNGQLTNEWTQGTACSNAPPASGMITSRSILSYDGMGRILSERQCIATKCATSSGSNLGYGYDLAGNQTSLTNSIGKASNSLVLNYTYDGVGRLTNIGSNWDTYPTNLYSVTKDGFSAVGPIQWSLGSNLTVTQGYTKRLWIGNITATGQVPVQ